MQRLNLNSKNIFLVDSLGAFLNAATLGLVLAPLEHIFGMPRQILYFLATLGIAYGTFSMICHWLNHSAWRKLLYVIIVANLVYAMLTIWLVIRHIGNLTSCGYLYFSLELLVMFILIRLEVRVRDS